MTGARFAAVDLGASSGRVMVGHVRPGFLRLDEVHRFPNVPVRVGETLYWDVLGIYNGVLDGLRTAVRQGRELASIGIDGWAVDYGLLDETGALLGNPVHYRDERTSGVMARVFESVSPQDIYDVTGVQFMSLNTIYQLVAQAESPQLRMAKHLLLVPDLMSYWLTGVAGTEVTNASTTQLLDVTSREWSETLMRRLDIDPGLFAPLREPRSPGGMLRERVASEIGSPTTLPVTTVCSHDTASAVVAVPAHNRRFAFISCGTWSLVGVELDAPVLTPASLSAGFTNELGIDGTVRYLRNVMGLWLLQECMRTWNVSRAGAALDRLLNEASRVPAFRAVVDVTDVRFLAPGDMPTRISEACRESGEVLPQSRPETVRCILDSLALAYRRAVIDAQQLSGQIVDVVHLVGGGAMNQLLCQLTADACGMSVVAGPVEAAALGNVLVQAQASGDAPSDLSQLRALVRDTQHLLTYTPQGERLAWSSAAARLPSR